MIPAKYHLVLEPSRLDIFAGYSIWATHGSVENRANEGSPEGANVSASLQDENARERLGRFRAAAVSN
jgi:hypothetical protein